MTMSLLADLYRLRQEGVGSGIQPTGNKLFRRRFQTIEWTGIYEGTGGGGGSSGTPVSTPTRLRFGKGGAPPGSSTPGSGGGSEDDLELVCCESMGLCEQLHVPKGTGCPAGAKKVDCPCRKDDAA